MSSKYLVSVFAAKFSGSPSKVLSVVSKSPRFVDAFVLSMNHLRFFQTCALKPFARFSPPPFWDSLLRTSLFQSRSSVAFAPMAIEQFFFFFTVPSFSNATHLGRFIRRFPAECPPLTPATAGPLLHPPLFDSYPSFFSNRSPSSIGPSPNVLVPSVEKLWIDLHIFSSPFLRGFPLNKVPPFPRQFPPIFAKCAC